MSSGPTNSTTEVCSAAHEFWDEADFFGLRHVPECSPIDAYQPRRWKRRAGWAPRFGAVVELAEQAAWRGRE